MSKPPIVAKMASSGQLSDERSQFSILPTECIAEILGWFGECTVSDYFSARLVSKQWQVAVAWMMESAMTRRGDLNLSGGWQPNEGASSWHRLALFSMPSMSALFLESFHSVDFSKWPKATNRDLELIAKAATHISRLSVRRAANIDDSSMKVVAEHCLDIRVLDVSEKGVANVLRLITDESMRSFARDGGQLEDLNISGTHGNVTDAAIIPLLQANPNMQILNVSLTAGKVTDSSCHQMAQFSKQLAVLDVSDTRGAISDDGLIAVANGCPNLHSLSVGRTGGKVTDRLFEALAGLHRNMTLIDVSDTSGKVTDKGLSALLPWCTNLKVFRARNIANNSIGRPTLWVLGKCCPRLAELDLFQFDAKCQSIESVGLTAVAGGCRRLRVVDLTRCLGISKGVEALLHSATELQALTLMGTFSNYIQENALSPLGFHNQLTQVALAGCIVSPELIAALVSRHLSLQVLQIQRWCQGEADKILAQVSDVGSSSLRVLDICGLQVGPTKPGLNVFLGTAKSLPVLGNFILPRVCIGLEAFANQLGKILPKCRVEID
jgi:hypothetical protein